MGDFLTPFKTASRPFQPKGVVIGIVDSVHDNLLDITVPRLSGDEIWTDVEYVASGFDTVPTTGERVLVSFLEGRQDDLIVLGRLRSTMDVQAPNGLWPTARTITLSGDVSGSVSIDGSADVTLATTITADSVTLGTDTVGNYVATIAGTADQVTVTGSGSESAAITLSLPQSIASSSTPTFAGLTLSGDLAVNGADITTTSTGAATVFNTNATTLSLGGAATTISVGASTGTTTVNNDLTVSGDLTVNGTTTTVNSTTITVDDIVLTLGGDTTPSSDDGKDRGVEFRWHTGAAARLGFFGYDNSTGKFTFIPNASKTSDVYSGTKGELDANVDWSNILSKPSPVITLSGDASGSATLTSVGNATLSATLATVNSTTGTFGDSVTVPTLTVNGKGLVTSVTATSIRSGTTSQTGIVSLTDSTSSTSTTTAATPNSVKSAYDLASAALPKSGGTMTGTVTLRAGTATAGTAPVYFASGTNLTTAAAGAMEFDGTSLYFTPSTTRKTIAFTDSALSGNTTGTAASWTTARTVTFSGGDTTGSFSISGSANVGSVVLTTQSASTTQAGIVQLSNSTSTTSSTLAATSTAVKSAYDLANAALPLSGGTMTGKLTFVASNSFAAANFGTASLSSGLQVTGDVWRQNDVLYFRKSTGQVNFVLSDDTTFLPLSGSTMTGKLTFVASNSFAAVNFGSASLSSGLQVTGDVWRQSDVLYFRKSTGQVNFVFSDDTTFLSKSGGTMTGKLTLVADNYVGALNFQSASMLGTPATGDVWRETDALKFRKTSSTVNFVFSDDGSGLQALNGSNITSGTVPAARLPFKYGKTNVSLGASGQGTIPHGLGTTPTMALVSSAQPSSGGSDTVLSVVVYGVDATNITVRAYEHDGQSTTSTVSAQVSSIYNTTLDCFWLVI